MQSRWSKLSAEAGLTTILNSSPDTHRLCLQRFIRLFAYGATFLILVQYLSSLDISDARIGLFMTLTLLGDVVISFVLTLITDQVGRRNVLAAGAALMASSGFVFAVSSNYWILLLASVVGVISPSGNEIGPFRAIEESILAQLTDKDQRSDIFAWYTLFGTAGAALGTLTTGLVVQALQNVNSGSSTFSYRIIFAGYGTVGIIKLFLVLTLSPAIELEQEPSYQSIDVELNEHLIQEDAHNEAPSPTPASQSKHLTPTKPPLIQRIKSLLPHISPLSRSILIRLILLFTMDSFASGLASPSWLTYFFTTVHNLQPAILGTLFLITNILAAMSNLVALPIARRIGPLKTMVFTHLPSAVLLGLIPLPPAKKVGTWIAMACLALRACTQSMDQAPRQAFLAAAVLPAERTAVLGVVNIAKTLAQAGGIGTAGSLAQYALWVVMFGSAGLLKMTYDLFMLWMFLGLKERDPVV